MGDTCRGMRPEQGTASHGAEQGDPRVRAALIEAFAKLPGPGAAPAEFQEQANPAYALLLRNGITLGPADRVISHRPTTATLRRDYSPDFPEQVRYVAAPDLPVIDDNAVHPNEVLQSATGTCGPASVLAGAARRPDNQLPESTIDPGDGQVIVRHFNTAPDPDNPAITRVTEGFTYYVMPKAVAIDTADGSPAGLAPNPYWPTAHLIAWVAHADTALTASYLPRYDDWRDWRAARVTAARDGASLPAAPEFPPSELHAVIDLTPQDLAQLSAAVTGKDRAPFENPSSATEFRERLVHIAAQCPVTLYLGKPGDHAPGLFGPHYYDAYVNPDGQLAAWNPAGGPDIVLTDEQLEHFRNTDGRFVYVADLDIAADSGVLARVKQWTRALPIAFARQFRGDTQH